MTTFLITPEKVPAPPAGLDEAPVLPQYLNLHNSTTPMYRPKKKKNEDPLIPEDKEQKVDERNLIDTGEAEEVTFEDRLKMFWMEHQTLVIFSCIALLLAVVGYQGVGVYRQMAAEEARAAFAEARANDNLAEYARENSDRELGGIAALSVADDAYGDGDYARAGEFYGLAAGALEGTPMVGRARMGRAFALYQSDNGEDGLRELESIVGDAELPDAARAEAAYHLAVEAHEAGRGEEFEDYADQIRSLAGAGPWERRLEQFIRQAG